ncbi:MAG: UvrD-helicase domain-containing protein [Raineya sp.]
MFQIYTSSAGSGKTYTLTKEYLKLALGNHDSEKGFSPIYFRKILAITFTKDAAQEMKARILSKLLAFIKDEDKDLQEKIAQEINVSVEELRLRAKATFEQIIYNYSDFAISTIDSFTNRVVSAFTQELNIPLNYELDMDTDSLTNNAAEELIAKVGQEEYQEITNFLINFLIDELNNGTHWRDLRKHLAEFTKELYNEKSRPIARKLAQMSLQSYSESISRLQKVLNDFECFLTEQAQKALDLIKNNNLQAEDFAGGTKGVYNLFVKLENKRYDEELFGKQIQKVLEGGTWASSKTPRKALIAQIQSQLQEILLAIHQHYKEAEGQNYQQYILAKECLRNLYKVALTKDIHRAVEEVKIKNNLVYIAETNEKIAKIVQSEPVPFIYERIGERFQHLLIDEFQDTSVLQWHNLLPLVENNLANGNMSLIVGDAKQAIYRWRGGEMEQIVHLAYAKHPEIGTESLRKLNQLAQLHFYDQNEAKALISQRYEVLKNASERKNLDTNFRSSPEIIQFNNIFFDRTADILASEIPIVRQVYDEQFKQKVPANAPNNGQVEAIFKAKTEAESYEDQVKKEVLRIIEEVLAKGFEMRDIALLFRNKSKAIQIATLLKEKGYPVVSVDSLVISSDQKVNFLMALLKVVANPENSLAKSEALYLFYKTILQSTPNQNQNEAIRKTVYSKNASLSDFLHLFAEKGYAIDYNYIQSLSLYEMVEEFIRIFKILEQHPTRLEFVFRFLDWIVEFEKQKQHNLNDFINEWNKKRSDIAVDIPAGSNAITISTIHKSKGLEYPVVVVPFADWQIYEEKNNIWIDTKNLPMPLEDEKKPPYLLARMAASGNTIIAQQQREEKNKSALESLNLLYVAFTRAVCQLYIIAKEKNSHGSYKNSVSRWISIFFENLSDYHPEYAKKIQQIDKSFYRLGNFDMNQYKKHPKESKKPFVLKDMKTVQLRRKLK